MAERSRDVRPEIKFREVEDILLVSLVVVTVAEGYMLEVRSYRLETVYTILPCRHILVLGPLVF